MIYLTIIVGLVCLALGFSWRELYELVRKVNKFIQWQETPRAKSEVTAGAYRPANEGYQSTSVVNPKSPQLMEWEANQRTLEQNGIIERSVKPK